MHSRTTIYNQSQFRGNAHMFFWYCLYSRWMRCLHRLMIRGLSSNGLLSVSTRIKSLSPHNTSPARRTLSRRQSRRGDSNLHRVGLRKPRYKAYRARSVNFFSGTRIHINRISYVQYANNNTCCPSVLCRHVYRRVLSNYYLLTIA